MITIQLLVNICTRLWEYKIEKWKENFSFSFNHIFLIFWKKKRKPKTKTSQSQYTTHSCETTATSRHCQVFFIPLVANSSNEWCMYLEPIKYAWFRLHLIFIPILYHVSSQQKWGSSFPKSLDVSLLSSHPF